MYGECKRPKVTISHLFTRVLVSIDTPTTVSEVDLRKERFVPQVEIGERMVLQEDLVRF